ncbi:cation efflux protein [Kickxella alabastrina]|uniref:cation efflux protein n=1 Tax=Kickxella alabastrina TaxID=61397 RepID=UPI002220691C|nr:cation efflux protein [Kickxella alabastrina]KAI7826360.1 cation efflux protein [Kickxella alabastrina]
MSTQYYRCIVKQTPLALWRQGLSLSNCSAFAQQLTRTLQRRNIGAIPAQAQARQNGHHQAGSRITLIGMGANVGMSVAKGIAGIYFHSSALLADAAHSMSDILGTLSRSDAFHPYGYGRYEALGTLFVSAFLVAAGVGIGMHALEQVVGYLPDLMAAAKSGGSVDGVAESARDLLASLAGSAEVGVAEGGGSLVSLGHTHGAAAQAVVDGAVVDPRAIWFAVGSIAVNEALFQATMKVGTRTKSNVLVANAWHHRSDALTSLVSVGAIGGAIMGFPVLDAIGGLVVSTMLARSGMSMTMEAIREITDTPPPMHLTEEVQNALRCIAEGVPGVSGIDAVQCRKSGPFLHVRANMVVAPEESAARIEAAVVKIRLELRGKLGFVQSVDINVETTASRQMRK